MNTQIDLSEFFITKSQAEDFKLRLDTVIEQMYSTNFNLEKSLINEFGIEKKDKFIMLLHENNIIDISAKNIQEFLTRLQEIVSSLTVVTLTIAYEPNQETLRSLSQWFIFNINKQVLFDFQINKKQIAGAMINFNGKFKDFTIKPLFDEIVKKNLSSAKMTTDNSKSLHQSTESMTIGR